jgi:type II secretory pathway pseudopilin PulG
LKVAIKPEERSASQAGFSLAELIIVVAIIMVVAGLSIPSLSRAIDNARLKGATQTLAAVYQDSRLRATQNDTAYEVLVSAGGAGVPARACIDLDGDGLCGTTDAATTFPNKVKLSNSGIPVPLDPQLKFPLANTESPAMHTLQDVPVAGLAWNSRGIPCQRSSAAAPCMATGWIQYVQLKRTGGSTIYGAVTVTPTGRVKTWIFIPSGSGNGQWL